MLTAILSTLLAAAPAAAPPVPGAEAEIMAAFDAFTAATAAQPHKRRSCGADLDRLLAPDFHGVAGTGAFYDRPVFIGDTCDPDNGDLDWAPVITDRVYVDLGPDAGMVGGEMEVRTLGNGPTVTAHLRFADTFRRIDGRWQLVYQQVTVIG